MFKLNFMKMVALSNKDMYFGKKNIGKKSQIVIVSILIMMISERFSRTIKSDAN